MLFPHRVRNTLAGTMPLPQADLLVGKALQLERLVGGPLKAGVDVEDAAFLRPGNERLDAVRDDGDGGAEDEDGGDAEDGEGCVGRAADFLADY